MTPRTLAACRTVVFQNFSQSLLTISNNRAPVRVVDMAFEDPQRGTCYQDDRCGWYELPSQPVYMLASAKAML